MVSAQPPAISTSQVTQTQLEKSRDTRLARDWGLRSDEWTRYRELMEGPLGIYSPNLDPLTALGIETRSDDERRRYADLQVQAEAQRVEKLLNYQRAYDAAWQRRYPGVLRVNLPDAMPGSVSLTGSGRPAVFVRDDCHACDQMVQRLQESGTEFDLYMVSDHTDDARIRDWARGTGINPAKVRSGAITLNHDAGRWQSLGLAGDLPAIVRQVDGQWQRQ
uniref:TIGR03759 family integrating conjugative element protein n=1 Tax=Marinobacterium profundum TaxID=1714300 RepID=UPI003F72F8CC